MGERVCVSVCASMSTSVGASVCKHGYECVCASMHEGERERNVSNPIILLNPRLQLQKFTPTELKRLGGLVYHRTHNKSIIPIYLKVFDVTLLCQNRLWVMHAIQSSD